MGEVASSIGAAVVMTNPDRFLKGAVGSRVTTVPTLAYVDEPRRIDHEPALRETLNPTTRRLYAPLRRRQAECDSRAVLAATVVATNSQYSRARIAAAYGRQAVVLPCGVPSSFLDTVTCDRPSHLLTVGSAIPTKGHELALRAAAASGLGLPVVLVTDGRGAEVRRLSAVAADIGTILDVRTRVPDVELRELYRTAFATLYLAQAEPLGLVSLEAQAAGCPVVVSDEGGLPETVDDGHTGFVVPRDPGAAAEALRRLATQGVRPAMSRAARERMRGATWSGAAGQLRTALMEMRDAIDTTRESRAGIA
jgi:glycosyltransferase involved in cell wall biosynthesis